MTRPPQRRQAPKHPSRRSASSDSPSRPLALHSLLENASRTAKGEPGLLVGWGGGRGGRRTGRGRRTCVRGRQRLADGGAAAGDGLDGDVLLNHPHLDGRPEGRVCREDAGYRGPQTASGSGDGAVKPHLAPTPPCAVGRGEPCGFGTLSLVAFLFFGGWGEGNCQKGCWKLRFTPNCRNVLMKPEFHGLFLHSRTVPGRLSWEDISVRAETQYK